MYQIEPPQADKESIHQERFEFLLEIGENFIKPLMLQRAQLPIGWQQKKNKNCYAVFDVDITVAQTAVRRQPADEPPKKKRCYVCPRKIKANKMKQND